VVVKETFSLLKGVPNVFSLSEKELSSLEVKGGVKKVSSVLTMIQDRIDHFAKRRVYKEISSSSPKLSVVKMDYLLPVTYNIPTNSMILNISYFGVDDILPTKPDPRNLYACLVYAIALKSLVSGKTKLPLSFFPSISTFLLSVFIRLFGKEFGFLGVYVREIPKLHFLLTCYVLSAFFGVSGVEAFKKASVVSSFDYTTLSDLDSLQFNEIDGFVESLSKTVMPGITRYTFASRVLKILTSDFLPALEDLSRFISVCLTCTVTGTTIVPTFLATKYNKSEFAKILEASKLIFK